MLIRRKPRKMMAAIASLGKASSTFSEQSLRIVAIKWHSQPQTVLCCINIKLIQFQLGLLQIYTCSEELTRKQIVLSKSNLVENTNTKDKHLPSV